MANITFHTTEQIKHPFPGKEQVYRAWLESVASAENKTIDTLTYIFCSDDFLLDINIKYLGHDYYTDIITFPYTEDNDIVSDLYISLDRVRENAADFQVSFENELQRVMVHGLLHLLGYKDKTEEDQLRMREMENVYLLKMV